MESVSITSARPAERYGATAIGLHWLIALLIIGGFYLGWIMTGIPGFTPTKLKYFSWHKWIGVTVFLLALTRLLWRPRIAYRPIRPACRAGRPAPRISRTSCFTC